MIHPLESRVLDINAAALGVAMGDLMENAGRGVAKAVLDRFGQCSVLIVCGTGNNGGDGAVAARYLAEKGCEVTLALVKAKADIKSQLFKDNLGRLPGAVKVLEGAAVGSVKGFDVMVDAMLGTGLRDPPREPFAGWARAMNDADAKVVSVDVPSGLGTGLAVMPDMTVSMHDAKVGMTRQNSGDVVIVDIGIPQDAARFVGPGEFVYYPVPSKGSHKGQNGRLVIVGGGPYTGAPALSAFGALAAGVDLVTIAAPEWSAGIIATYSPNFIVRPLEGDRLGPEHAEAVGTLVKDADALLVGPGLGRARETQECVRRMVDTSGVPLVIDADGLYALLAREMRPFEVQAVLTPHRKEFARLAGVDVKDISDEGVVEMAKALNATMLLKGAVDLVTDGERTKHNRTGNAAMSVGGTGDVLAGIVAGLMAKGAKAFDAARMGAYLSGMAGDLAFEELGYSLTAIDVAESVPQALKRSLAHVL